MPTKPAEKPRLRISSKERPAMTVYKEAVKTMRLVYFLVADKKVRYAHGRSRIVYIGTTEKGALRFARSAARRADDVFKIRGVQKFEVFTVTCKGGQDTRFWTELERAFLLGFREAFGEWPKCNELGVKEERGEFRSIPGKKD